VLFRLWLIANCQSPIAFSNEKRETVSPAILPNCQTSEPWQSGLHGAAGAIPSVFPGKMLNFSRCSNPVCMIPILPSCQIAKPRNIGKRAAAFKRET
jgi:hypothetical protein